MRRGLGCVVTCVCAGGRQDIEWYQSLIKYCQGKGNVLTEHIGKPSIEAMGEVGAALPSSCVTTQRPHSHHASCWRSGHAGGGCSCSNQTGVTEEFIYTRDMDWLRTAECVISEVTQPSLGTKCACIAWTQVPVLVSPPPLARTILSALGVGYELGFAESINIPVLCL